jgi:uncharacterized membrane protein
MTLHQITHEYLGYLTHWIEMVGIAVIIWGFLIAFKDLMIYEFSKMKRRVAIHEMRYIRVTLGNYILFGLEFMIASDIIGSIVNRSTEELVNLVIIVIVRTTISYFLGKEIEALPPRK